MLKYKYNKIGGGKMDSKDALIIETLKSIEAKLEEIYFTIENVVVNTREIRAIKAEIEEINTKIEKK